MQQGPIIRIGLVAEVADYAITIVADTVTVAYRDKARIGQVVITQEVHHLARFIRHGTCVSCWQPSRRSRSSISSISHKTATAMPSTCRYRRSPSGA